LGPAAKNNIMLDAGAPVSNRCMIEAGGSERYIDMELAGGGRAGRGTH